MMCTQWSTFNEINNSYCFFKDILRWSGLSLNCECVAVQWLLLQSDATASTPAYFTHPCLYTVCVNLSTIEGSFELVVPPERVLWELQDKSRLLIHVHTLDSLASRLPGALIFTTSPSLCVSVQVYTHLHTRKCACVSLTSVGTGYTHHMGLFWKTGLGTRFRIDHGVCHRYIITTRT